MKTIVEIEERINRLKSAKHAHANEIAKLENQIEVINVELEKVLIEKAYDSFVSVFDMICEQNISEAQKELHT